MDNESKLAPCPWCNGTNIKVHLYSEHVDGEPDAFCQCHDCSVIGPNGADEDSAIAAWNKRAAPTSADSAQEGEAFEKWALSPDGGFTKAMLHRDENGEYDESRPADLWAAWQARAALAAPKQPTDDRSMLLAVLKDLEISSWQCPRCGHAEDCKDMDVAYMLRDYFSRGAAPKQPMSTPSIHSTDVSKKGAGIDISDERIVQAVREAGATGRISLTHTNNEGVEVPTFVAKHFIRAVFAAAQGEKK